MGDSGGAVDPIKNLRPGRDTWKIRVRVIRVWAMTPIDDPSSPYSMQFVLIDSEGQRIEATVRKTLIQKFKNQISEGKAYKIVYFVVAANGGGYRASSLEYKIIFNGRTRVVPEESDSIPRNMFSFKTTTELLETGGECDYLIDLIGLVTNVIPEKQTLKGDKVTRMIELEITDVKGKIQCAFFGNYVDIVKGFVENAGDDLPVAVIQFAKVKTFKGNVVVQNVLNATSLLFNADIPEVASFRDGIASHDIPVNVPLMRNLDPIEGRSVTIADEFLSHFPRKTVNELNSTVEDGIFIVFAEITGFVEGEKWWYPSCRCHKAVTVEDGLYHCGSCATYVLGVCPRFRIKLQVSDGDDLASFVIFDADAQYLVQKACMDIVSSYKGTLSDSYPDEIRALVGKKLLFKVQKSSDHPLKFDGSFKVKKICDDTSAIDTFKDNDTILTPQKLVNNGKFNVTDEGVANFCGPASSGMSEITPSVIGLDNISVEDDPVLSSLTNSSASVGTSEITPPVNGLDDISAEDDIVLSSLSNSTASVSSISRRPKRTRLTYVKVEKE